MSDNSAHRWQQTLPDIMRHRRSVRAFLSQPVERATIERILRMASFAPSGTNCQPWKVYVVAGAVRAGIVKAVSQVCDDVYCHPEKAADYREPFEYYPQEWISPYIERRRQNGLELYGLLDIQKGEKAKMHQQHLRNFCFFDAPVGLFLTTHRTMGNGAKMDIAMFMQNIMLQAQYEGLGTCAQAAWNAYHSIVLPLLGASNDEVLVSAMALGYPDVTAKVNQMHPPRVDVAEFATFQGF